MAIRTNNNGCSRFFTLICAMVALFIIGCGQLHGRDEFSKLVMDKNEKDVISAVGKPTSVDSSDPKHVIWVYKSATYDITHDNKMDEKTQVIMAPGPDGTLKVIDIQYG